MNEQLATHAYGSRPAKQDDTIYITDEPAEDDDTIEGDDEDSYPRFHNRRTRQVSIERTYRAPRTPAANRTIMHVTRHAGPPPAQRTSRTSATTTTPPPRRRKAKRAQKRLHWLFFVGGGMLASMALWMVGSAALSWLQVQHDNSVYGYPRTYQVDANVGHQGTSHFVVENLAGDIIVLEIHPSNLSLTRVYQGPEYTGAGADDYVATVAFKDLGNGKPDMIISVNDQRFVWINDGAGFRPATASDHIDQQEVN